MKFNKTAIRSISATLVLAQLSLAMQPLMAATREDKGASSPMAQAQLKQMQALQRSMDEARTSKAQAAQSPADRASSQLARIEELVRDLDDLRGQLLGESSEGRSTREQERAIGPMMKAKVRPLTKGQKTQLQNRRDALWDELRGLLAKQADDQAAVRAEFAQNRRMLIDRKLPQVIMQRHDDAVRDFEQRVSQFNRSLSSLSANPEAAATELKGFFDQYPTTRRAAPVDPKNLPWRTPEPTKRMPAETQTAWFQNLYGREGTRLAQTGNSLEGLTFITPPEPGTAPTAADLAETPETQRTADIVAKAKELGNNPVNIQNWVRNNVEWIPTWGAVQSAQDTLDKKRGNAIDIASLQIALLRAAKIPARYQFGTIELPAEQVMNWVGSVTKPEAAQQLLGQGGIANRGLIEGGRISKLRMEHAWVQVYVNWMPGRGARQGNTSQHPNPIAQRNAWVQLDASFKQHSYAGGLDVKASVPLSAQALLESATQGVSGSGGENYSQGLNQQAIRGQLEDYQSRLNEFIERQGGSVSIGDVVGKKINPVRVESMLTASLPYAVVNMGSSPAEVPAGLQHKFSYKIYENERERAFGNQIVSYTANVSQIVGRRFSISYVPASQADADVIAGYMPKVSQAGGNIVPRDFPTNLPAYLIYMKPQLVLDGRVVATGSKGIPMGTALAADGGFTSFSNMATWDITSDGSHIVGNSTAIGVSAHGLSSQQLVRLKARMEVLKREAEAQNLSNVMELSAGLLVAPIWTWFLEAESKARDAARLMGIVYNGGLSYGLFHNVASPTYSWGVIKSVRFSGANLDIGHVRNLSWSRANDQREWAVFNLGVGQYMSALEHIIPERIFSPRNECNVIGEGQSSLLLPRCPGGISAIKAIGLASQQGQKVFSISPDEYQNDPGLVGVQLGAHSVSTRNAIESYLGAGMVVTVHQSPVSQDGWRGAGYIFVDPNTGSGGYIIEGGSNGGALEYLKENSTNIGFGLFAAGLLAAGLPAWVGLVIGVAAFLAGIIVMYLVYMDAILDAECSRAIPCIQGLAMISTIFVLMGLFFLKAPPGIGSLVAGIAGLIFADDMFNAVVGKCNELGCRSPLPKDVEF